MLKTLIRVLTVSALCLAGAAVARPAAAELVLVADGQPRAAVVLPAEPDENERLAAEELVSHLELISGVRLPVAVGTPVPGGLVPLRLGAAADVALAQRARAVKDNPSSFTLEVGAAGAAVRGVSSEGTLFGVYELLEQLGVRWYMPGDLGRVLPESATVRLERQETIQAPDMDYRRLQHISGGRWPARVRLGGDARSTGRHGIPGLPRGDFSENPEWYSLIDGQRRARQDCLSNPEVLERAVAGFRRAAAAQADAPVQYVGASSHDGSGYCECEGCLALDQGVVDPTADRVSMTDRYIWFFNRVLEELEDEFPNLHIVTYAYGAHMMPPAIEIHPRIIPVFAPITVDRIRGMDNPMSPDRHIVRWLIDEYDARGLNEMYYRGYYNNLACVSFPFSQVDRVRHETPVFREKGINVMRVEVIRQGWANNAITLYLVTRLMWDVNTDVDALLAEFADKFYGPAAGPMGQYWEDIDAAFRDTPYFTGSSYVYFPVFDDARRASLRRLLTEAARRTARHRGREPYAERVRVARLAFDRMELFLDLIEARNRHDYVTAHRLMGEFYELSDYLADYHLEPEVGGRDGRSLRLLNWRERSDDSGSYFNRFFERPIPSGYHRTVEAGELVAGLPDEWDFLLDPSGIGELGGWQRPGPLGGNWQRLKTSSRSWSDQGLHYYKGLAWYRTEVEIPERFRGRRIYLWLGGVDNVATVWVNGRYLGTSIEPGEGLPGVPGSFRPFDVEATGALRFGPGETNTVTIRVNNHRLSEVGTGGITAPVMFWSPRDADWRPGG